MNELRSKVINGEITQDGSKPFFQGAVSKASLGFLKARAPQYSVPAEIVLGIYEDQMIKDSVLCIDDFERKDDSLLKTSLVLGYISDLVERLNCKVILIYNSQKIDSDPEYNIYREKVITREIRYNPSIFQNLDVAWEAVPPNHVFKIFSDLDVNNIRVMRKVRDCLSDLRPLIDRYPSLRIHFESSCVQLSIFHYVFSDIIEIDSLEGVGTPRLPAVKTGNQSAKLVVSDRDYLIARSGYSHAGYHNIIVDYIKNGYIDLNTECTSISILERDTSVYASDELLRSIERRHETSFSTSEREYINELKNFIRSPNASDSPDAMERVRNLLSRLEPSPEWEELSETGLKNWIARYKDISLRDLEYLIGSSEIRRRVIDDLGYSEPRIPIADALSRITNPSGYCPEDLNHLANVSDKEFEAWLASEASTNTLANLKIFFVRFGSSDEQTAKSVCENLKSALEKIGRRSSFDRQKVESVLPSSD